MKSASVYLDTHYRVGEVDRRIFGGFLEHLGRAVYGGVFEPDNAHGLSDPSTGFRTDVLDALRPLGLATVRYPGGNFVSSADWKDGIGPRESRRRRPDFAWKSIETNQFGVDDFMAWCRQLGTTPMMAVNLGTAGATDAAQLLEYCNLSTATHWADQRRANGHADPYDVKLWCLGNEMDGPWQAGHVPAEVYAQRARAAGAMMKGLDPTIQTVVCGSSGSFLPTYLEWDRTVLEGCWKQVDFISAHHYSTNYEDDSPRFLGMGVEIDRVLDDYAGVINFVRGRRKSAKPMYVAFDEWNVWYKDRNGDGLWQAAPHLLEEVYNFEDALVCAQYLSAFIRRADLVKVACLAQIVNVIGAILTRPTGVLLQSIYHPFAMISNSTPSGSVSLRPIVNSPLYAAGSRGDIPALDVAAVYDVARSRTAVFLTNRSTTDELTVDIQLADIKAVGPVSMESLSGVRLKAANTWEFPHAVSPRQQSLSPTSAGTIRVTLPAPSFVALRSYVVGR